MGLSLALTLTGGVVAEVEALAPSLRGSPAAMMQQNRVAKDHGLAFYRTGAEIRAAFERGYLVELSGNENYAVADFVSFPYLQPAGKLFIERLSAQYREACGQKLVVTSAVRPTSGQPSNAHRLSVHPAGMAVDLRVSDRASCRDWLESALLNLETRGVLNGIREFHPPHYHVAIFPEQYLAYAEERMKDEEAQAEVAANVETEREAAAVETVLQQAPVVTSLVAAPAEAARPDARRQLAGAIAGVLLVPFGLGVLIRRRLQR